MDESKLEEIYQYIDNKINHSVDSVSQELIHPKKDLKIKLLYIKTLCDPEKIQRDVVKPFFESDSIKSYLKSLEGYKEYEDKEKALNDLVRGNIVLFIEDEILLLNMGKNPNNAILDASVETTIQGPQNALSEDLITNINLIRSRYHQTSLVVEKCDPVGENDKMDLVLLYDNDKAKSEIVNEVKKRLKKIKNVTIQSVGELQREFDTRGKTLFPTYMITERPDRIVYNLAKGKVVLMLAGTPFVMVVPAVFFDFMRSMEDLYQPYWVSKFLVILRYTGLFVSLLLPSAYIGISSFNPEIFRIQLTLSIAGSRLAVPYPSFVEVLFMLLMMELLVEASIRLPKTIGSTATTVGGLILGQAAVEAGLVSNIMIIIVAAVAISNFVVPINEMSFSMRVVKYLLLTITALTGIIGLIVGFLGLIIYLAGLKSFKEPYFRLRYDENPETTNISKE
ncbi:spore germination protein [Litchfieldia alkalitelluris]|uniref:spore germination protein n=1 Tax=Litchfieldia alkalitelluris TaxID=304268 RepID=UPI000995E0B4|nr:spore germination protein [Litchfieldia alkalitelluris]